MYNEAIVNRLISFIESNNGIGNKEQLAALIQKEFDLVQDRKVFSNENFAIRFSRSKNKRMSNTVLALSALKKYDTKPFFVCIVAPSVNYLLLANTTFLKKISHSSQTLRVDNIKGSFNGSDIMTEFQGIENEPRNFKDLFAYHEGFSFQDNLERLIESTNGIVGRRQKFNVTPNAKKNILNSISRASTFMSSSRYRDLRNDLDARVAKAQKEIAIAARIDNVNERGRVIEYLITENESSSKQKIIEAVRCHERLPEFKTKDNLGDYSKDYPEFRIETDIKTKVLLHNSNPKAYNIDKLLEFLADDKSVYMIYLLGIGENVELTARLCSVFDARLIDNTNIIHHWAGRNSRGVAQFIGAGLSQILTEKDCPVISDELAREFLEDLIAR